MASPPRTSRSCASWDQGDDIEDLIRSGATVDPSQLADPLVPLANLLASAGAVAEQPSRR
jgi:hypothetical protein